MKMNENLILDMVAQHTSDNTLALDAFDNLFSILSRDERDAVADILAANNISLVNADDMAKVSTAKFTVDGSIFGGNDPLAFSSVVVNKGSALNNELLARAAQSGNEDAKAEICVRNRAFVWDVVLKYTGMYGISLTEEDLEMAGMCGMLTAIDHFKYDLGWKFTTYAEWWIRQAITREIADHGYTIRIPVHKQDQIRKVCRTYHDLYRGEMTSAMRVAKTAETLGLSESAVMECLQLKDYVMGCTSLDMPIGEDGDTYLSDLIPADHKDNPENQLEQICLKNDINDVLSTLTPREEKVIRLRYGLDDGRKRTLEEVGKVYNVTRERIRQIEMKALRKLRQPSRSKKLKDWLVAA